MEEKDENIETKDKMSQLEEYIKKIESYNFAYQKVNSQLEKEKNDLENNFKELEEKYNKLLEENKNLKTENNKLLNDNQKSEIDKIQEELEEKNKIIENKENELNTLQKDNENAIKELNEKIENLEKQLSEKEKQLNEKEIQLSEKEKQFSENESKYNSMQIELKETHSKFDGAINQFEKLESENKELKEKNQNLEKYEKENSLIKSQNDQLIQGNETKSDFLVKPAEEYYDIVIDISSICSLRNEGWEIKYNQERKDIYQKIIGEQTIKIGVIGLNNVGKSFLLSKIVRVEIPTGYSVETKGISIKYAQGEKGEEEGVCILDSAGFETPLLIEDKKNENEETEKEELEKEEDNKDNIEKIIKLDEIEDELSRDKAQTERFIEQLIISLSDMIILVVGKLTRTEQRLITRIKNLARRNEKNKIKSIIIVHNLAQYHRIMEVEKHINNYLKVSATFKLLTKKVFGIPNYKDRTYYVEKLNEQEDIEVFHYIMAKDGTEAGKFYNNLTIELIKQQYNQFNKRRRINIPEQITRLFSELSTEIIGEKMECETLESNENRIKLKNNKENKNTDKFIIQNQYVDQDGNYLQNKGKFEPKYSLYFYKEINEEEEEEENYLLLRLEIPGNITKLTARSTDLKKEKYRGIVIKGYKDKDKFEEEKKTDFKEISDNRNYEEFSYFIELKRNLELSKKTAIGNTEIYKIKFDKRNKEKAFKETTKNKDIEKKTIEANNIESKEVEGEMIASGVYIMKFALTENSFT